MEKIKTKRKNNFNNNYLNNNNIINEIKIFIIVIGTILIMNGYHSIDLVYNFQNLASYDMTLSGKVLNIDTIYRQGIIQTIIGIIFIIVGNKIK